MPHLEHFSTDDLPRPAGPPRGYLARLEALPDPVPNPEPDEPYPSDEEWAAWELVMVDGLTQAQAAERLNVSQRTVGRRVRAFGAGHYAHALAAGGRRQRIVPLSLSDVGGDA